jgi:hypothetical protein
MVEALLRLILSSIWVGSDIVRLYGDSSMCLRCIVIDAGCGCCMIFIISISSRRRRK